MTRASPGPASDSEIIVNLATIVWIVIALIALSSLSRLLFAAMFGKSIGKAALARQPDAIHLEPIEPARFRYAARVESLAAEFQGAGFESAGAFAIPEMPGVCVHLLAHRADSMAGAIYDHPAVGVFYDVYSRYVDGGACTYTTARATGLDPRPKTQTVNAPGAEPLALIERARRERPPYGLKGCSTSIIAAEFTAAYAENMAWLKQRGISTREVVEVAKRQVA
jgi:hypothetical protein